MKSCNLCGKAAPLAELFVWDSVWCQWWICLSRVIVFVALVIALQKSKSCNLWVIIKLCVLCLLITGPFLYWLWYWNWTCRVTGSPFCTAWLLRYCKTFCAFCCQQLRGWRLKKLDRAKTTCRSKCCASVDVIIQLVFCIFSCCFQNNKLLLPTSTLRHYLEFALFNL